MRWGNRRQRRNILKRRIGMMAMRRRKKWGRFQGGHFTPPKPHGWSETGAPLLQVKQKDPPHKVPSPQQNYPTCKNILQTSPPSKSPLPTGPPSPFSRGITSLVQFAPHQICLLQHKVPPQDTKAHHPPPHSHHTRKSDTAWQ